MTAREWAGEPVRLRRAVLLSLMLGVTCVLIWLAVGVLAPGGWTVVKVALLACLAVNAPWLGLSAATGLVGFAIRMLARDPVAAVLPQLRLAPAEGAPLRTAIAVCVRNEDVPAVIGRLRGLAGEIVAGGLDDGYVLCLLSDTSVDEIAAEEYEAAAALRAETGLAVLYRRRRENTGFKAGNVMSFLDAHAGAFELMLCLDADSEMSLAAISRMVAVMRADPKLAILQATFAGQPAQCAFTRMFGFGHRHGLRIWATGQAWWQADQGPYWGHNAILRVAPFRAHCRLDPLPDGALILSHDHVEAARLQAARWKVRVLADDRGSFECHPPSLPDYLQRDVRWAAGNMQYRYLLARRDLGRLGRLQMLQAILHYVLTPFWFAMLPLAALNCAMGGARSLPEPRLAVLMAAGWLALHGPKLLGYVEAFCRPDAMQPARPSRPALLRLAAAEIGTTLLLDPIIAAHKSWSTLRLLAGGRSGWSAQVRDEHRVSWGEAWRLFWPHMLAGLAITGVFACGSWRAAALSLPVTAGLLLAVPFACLTTHKAGGRAAEHSPATGRL